MKRIIFYAAAVGIFVSSVLAKPARGAVPSYAAGGGCGQDSGCWLLSDNGFCLFPGFGFGWDCFDRIPACGESDGWNTGETAGTPEEQQGVEWFPGQGPEMLEPEGQRPEIQCPEAQCPEVQYPETQAPDNSQQGVEWFPGQGGGFWQPDSNPDSRPDDSADQRPGAGQQPGMGTQPGAGQQPGTGTQPGTGQQSGGTDSMASYITRIVELVNVQRAAAGLAPVTASAVLSSAADVRAQEIVSNFSHYRPNGTYFNTVLNQRGIAYNGAGENIAYGYDTPERVMTEWMNSAGHRANILDSRYTKLGVGYYTVGGVRYWTQLFTY